MPVNRPVIVVAFVPATLLATAWYMPLTVSLRKRLANGISYLEGVVPGIVNLSCFKIAK